MLFMWRHILMTNEIKVKIQHMFPNCSKYKHCCVESDMPQVKWGTPMPKVKETKVILPIVITPLDFEGW